MLGGTAFGMQLLGLGIRYIEAREETKPFYKKISFWSQLGIVGLTNGLAFLWLKTPEAKDVAAIVTGSVLGRMTGQAIVKMAPPSPAPTGTVSIPRLVEEPAIQAPPEEERRRRLMEQHPIVRGSSGCRTCSEAIV